MAVDFSKLLPQPRVCWMGFFADGCRTLAYADREALVRAYAVALPPKRERQPRADWLTLIAKVTEKPSA